VRASLNSYLGIVRHYNTYNGIVFSATATSDPGVTFTAATNPGNAELYQVTDGNAFVGGTANAGDTVMFRIGLQKQFTAYKPDDDANPNPARYAVVLLSFAYCVWEFIIQ